MLKIVFSLTLSLMCFCMGFLQAGILDKAATGKRIYLDWDQIYVDRGDIKITIKRRVYRVPTLYSTGKRLYVKKKDAKYVCKAKWENYYPLPTPGGCR